MSSHHNTNVCRPLQKQLSKLFKAAAPRKPDTYRKEREEAKSLAALHSIEIEKFKEGGFNVWPPKNWQGEDPFEGDHYANDWADVAEMVRVYSGT